MKRPAFLTDLELKMYGAKSWQVRSPLEFMSRLHPVKITVPIGFETDLASIPRLARLVLPVNDLHRPAAAVHDWLYVKQTIGGEWITRSEADAIFLEAMICLGVSRWKAYPMWLAVRCGGWVFFNKRARANGNEHYR